MKDYRINIFYSKEDKGYIADIPDLRHCSAFGASQEEALQEALKAKEAWIKAAISNNNIPSPQVPSRNISGCVKKITTEKYSWLIKHT